MSLHFQHSWLLFGLIGVALPWLFRWLQTRNPHYVRWAAMQFLEQTIIREAARVRKQNRWRLFIRMAIIGFMVLALAGPVWAPRRLPLLGPGEQYVLLLFDDSYSMRVQDADRTQFEIAKQQALRWMDQQPSQTHYGILTFSDIMRLGEHTASAATYTDTKSARNALRQLQPSFRADTFAEILPVLQNLLRTRPEPVKQVCVFTDGQRRSWSGAKLSSLSQEASIRLILPTRRQIDNLSLVRFESSRRVYAVGEPASFTCEVANTGTMDHEQTWLKLVIGSGEHEVGETVASIPMEVPTGERKTIHLPYQFQQPGFYPVTATLGSDDLSVDNERYTLVEIVPYFRVLCVGPSTRYVALALSPDDSSPIRAELADDVPQSLSNLIENRKDSTFVDGIRYDAVVITRPWDMTDARILTDYLRGGGILLVFLGPEFSVPFDQELEWIPAGLGAPIEESRTLNEAEIQRSWELLIQPDSQILLADSQDKPLVVRRDYGQGSVFYVGTSAGPPWNHWHIQPDFLPWLHRTLRDAWERNRSRPIWEIGGTPAVRMPDPSTSPSGLLEWPEEPGIYSIPSIGTIILNPDAREMDLRAFNLVWFWQYWPEVEAFASSDDQLSFVRQTYALWPWLWVLTMSLACYEVWISRTGSSG